MIQRTRVDPPITHVRFVMNWFEDLRKRLPADQ
jgi:hypothetical protein